MIGIEMTLQELLELPVSVDLVTAGRAFGLGRTRSFELAQAGEFPCKVLKVGIKYRVPRSALFEALGFDPAAAVSGRAGDKGDGARPSAGPADHRASRRHRGSTRARADLGDDAAAAVG